jgi:hypothetical protein
MAISIVIPTAIDIEEIEMFADMSDGKYLNENELSQITDLYNNNFYIEPIIPSK